MAAAVLLVFGVGGVLKLADLPGFVDALQTWTLIPSATIPMLAFAVPCTEMAIPAIWFLGSRGFAWRLAIGFMISVTTLFLAQASLGSSPRCGCFGGWQPTPTSASEPAWLLTRNGVVLILLLLSARAWRESPSRASTNESPGDARPCPSTSARGFTLIEALLVVAIVAIAVTLILPSLRGVRDAARLSASLSNLKQHSAIFAIYAADHNDQFPFVTHPEATYTVIRGGGRELLARFFEARLLWAIALADHYYDGQANHAAFFSPSARFGDVELYHYSATCYSAPAFWSAATRSGPVQWVPVRHADVLFPSSKGVLACFADSLIAYNHYGSSEQARVEIAFADGSAAAPRRFELSAPFGPAEGPWFEPPQSTGQYVIHTVGGVRARDLLGTR